jgi:hypothetical protein
MSRELPFPISFELPQGWASVSPESCGQPDAAFVAIRKHNAADPVVTNFVVNGFAHYGQPVDVAALADAHVGQLRSQYPVTVLKRDVMADDSATEAAQLLQIAYPAGESTLTLRQIQIISVFPGTNDGDAAVLQLIMTCPDDVFDQAGPEFSAFVATITPVQGTDDAPATPKEPAS